MLSGIVGPTRWQRTGRLIEAMRPMARQARLRSSTARRSTPPNATASRRGKPWRLLLVAVATQHRNGPSADCVPRPLVSELRLGGPRRGEPDRACRGRRRADRKAQNPVNYFRNSGYAQCQKHQALVFVRLAHDRRFVGAVLFLFVLVLFVFILVLLRISGRNRAAHDHQ